jgi:hypothetical protein
VNDHGYIGKGKGVKPLLGSVLEKKIVLERKRTEDKALNTKASSPRKGIGCCGTGGRTPGRGVGLLRNKFSGWQGKQQTWGSTGS